MNITSVATLMEQVVDLFESVMTMVGQVATTAVGNPLILTFMIVGLAFTGINMFRRFLSL